MEPSYIIRLDDACPTNNLEKWDLIEASLDKYEIKPIVAVIPDNKDKDLQKFPFDNHFWDRVHRWKDKGWLIALHGCTHGYITKIKGIVPLNSYSEFAGVPINIQREKIKNGYRIFLDHNIKPNIWVAPAHTFDKNTLKVLMQETDIRIVSDGLSMLPYNQYGFFWIPQQLWGFQKKEKGVWTICLHPETITSKEIDSLLKSISNERSLFEYNLNDLVKNFNKRVKGGKDYLFKYRFLARKEYDHLYLNNQLFRSSANLFKTLLLNK